MNPFNNDYFNGRCDKVRNPKTLQYDRLPWNIGVLNYQVSPSHLWNKQEKQNCQPTCRKDLGNVSFQTLVEETASREIYEDSHSLLREMLKEMSVKVDAGLSFKFKSTEPSMSNNSLNLEASLEYEKKTMIKELSELTNIQVRVTGHTTLV